MNEQLKAARQSMTAVPAARVDDLIVTEAADEVLIYDNQRHQIHHLNHTSAVIWRLCDGVRTVVDLAQLAGTELSAKVDEATINLALAKLSDADLLDHPVPQRARGAYQSRRALIRKVAVAGAIAVPAVVSMTALNPAAAYQATCNPQVCGNQSNPGSDCTCTVGTVVHVGACVTITNKQGKLVNTGVCLVIY